MQGCTDFRRRFDVFLDGEADGKSMRDLALHLVHCTACEGDLRRAERLQARLAEAVWAEADRVDSRALWDAVQARLEPPPVPTRERWKLFRLARPEAGAWWPLAALAGVLALVLGGALLLGGSPPERRAAESNRAHIFTLATSAPEVAVWSEPEQQTMAIWVASYEP